MYYTEAKQPVAVHFSAEEYMMCSARRAPGVTCQARPVVGCDEQLDGALSDFIVFGRVFYRQRSPIPHCQRSPERSSQGPAERVRSTLHAGLQMRAVIDQQLIIDRSLASTQAACESRRDRRYQGTGKNCAQAPDGPNMQQPPEWAVLR